MLSTEKMTTKICLQVSKTPVKTRQMSLGKITECHTFHSNYADLTTSINFQISKSNHYQQLHHLN